MKTVLQLLPALAGARVVGDLSAVRATRVHTDTRSLQAGDLFVALQGERFDAHTFLPQARAAGAVAAVARQGLAAAGLPGVEVPDTRLALGELARRWREQFDLPLIAVTGSNGKTTVTQMIASILRAAAGEGAHATQGNLNNDIGVPLTLLRLTAAHRLSVVELGMNHPGEIAYLAALARPTVALVNNAQREHQEFMGTVEAVARENGQVIAALRAGGTAVFPSDDEHTPVWRELALGACAAEGVESENRPQRGQFLPDLQPHSPAMGQKDGEKWTAAGGLQPTILLPRRLLGRPALTFSDTDPAADVRAVSAQWADGAWALRLTSPAGEQACRLRIAGRHNVRNALAAAACALAAGVSLADIGRGLDAFEPVGGRSRALAVPLADRTLTLIDDSYNANPDSVVAAIRVLAELPAPRCLVLGDMGEVGEQGLAFHLEVLRQAQASGIEAVHCAGDWMRQAVDALRAAGEPAPTHWGDVDALAAQVCEGLRTALPPVRSVLVKGSRFMRMERVVQAVQALAVAAAPEPHKDVSHAA